MERGIKFISTATLLTALLLSCNPPIEGELTLLVENNEAIVYSPCWSADGSEIYFVSSPDEIHETPCHIWSVNLSDDRQMQVADDTVWTIDISPEGDLCVTYLDGWIRVFETETWTKLDSFAICEKATEDWRNKFYAPRFSYKTNEVVYYYYHVYSKSSYLHKVNLADSTDELILTTEGASVVAPGPGDTLLAFGDTIYNLNTQERIYIDIPDDHI